MIRGNTFSRRRNEGQAERFGKYGMICIHTIRIFGFS